MNPSGDDKKKEFKPKSMGQPTSQPYNPYNNYVPNQYSNMYNPYEGMMYSGYQGGNYYNPSMMNQNPYVNTQNPYGNPYEMNQYNNQSNQIPGMPRNDPPKTSTIIGMDPNKAKKKAEPAKDNFSQKPQQQQPPITQKPQTQQTTQPAQAKKPVTQPKKEEAKKETQATQPKKTATTTEGSVAEITKKVEEIKLDTTTKPTEVVLETDSKEGTMIEIDHTRKPVTIVFIGHVDAGKSTIAGSILYRLGQIDERTIEKYQREAKANNRESWFIAYIMDVNDEERERGKTVEVGKAFFETPCKRFTVLDAPGHASFVPNMLQGACLADYAALVISAKTGEFEAGFEKDGRTREHALLAKSLGVSKLVVIINKMDEDSVRWSQERYDQIKKDLSNYLRLCGYNLEKHVSWIPMSGLTGDNMIKQVDKHKCPWYDGPTLMELLDSLELPQRNENDAVRVPILDRYKDQGIHVIGKVESGTVKYGATYTLMPNKTNFEVGWLWDSEERGVPYARPGEMIRMKIKGIDNELEIMRGGIVCSPEDVCPVFNTFEAEIQVLDLPEKKQIMTNGYQCILHYHTTIEECTIDLIAEIDRKLKTEKKVKFIRSQTRAKVVIKTNNLLCGEKFDKFATLGRFTLRDEGKTIAIGKILRYKPAK